ncbi:MINDY family-like protein [Phanerochaete sordida]|uniref:MINDY family-like protein n=1 Tax=Phanerochaete sordida TaxID=48140 RepID=A0A9P3G0U3_9APHY|nr:MINDY family-like protein [Phanerochaete sordida]
MAETATANENNAPQPPQPPEQEVWKLKEVQFKPYPDEPAKTYRIITQNFNGPCSFIAICNILILRGYIAIHPPERTTVTYEQLAHLVSNYLLAVLPGVDISAALSVMPVTRRGMDLNPAFTEVTAFRPAGYGGELKLFEYAGIQLVHGWLPDPTTREYEVLRRYQDYDTCANLLAEADHISRGQLLQLQEEGAQSEGAGSDAPPSHQRSSSLSSEEQRKLEDALIIRQFLDHSSSQLTYHGLFALASTVKPGTLVALFRNSHLSVMYKCPDPNDSALYTLATDEAFLHEPSVVWERLEDVDGGWSSFVDADFKRASPAGGDYAGHTGETALAALEAPNLEAMTLEERADYELAQQLQREEDDEAHQMQARRRQEVAEQQQHERMEAMKQEAQDAAKKQRKSKKGDCIIM